jgi:serine/threonine-protein kinase HipA
MKIGKRTTLAELDLKGWTAFAADTGLGLPLIRRRVTELSESVQTHVEPVANALIMPGLDAKALMKLAALATERAQKCSRTVMS